MKQMLFKIFTVSVVAVNLASCSKDLNRTPTNATTSSQAFSTPAGYKEALAKVYGAFALTGSSGSGSSDLGGIDAGNSDFLRLYWEAQELTTDEAASVWSDPGLPDFHNFSWTSGNVLLNGLYNRSMYQVTVCNEFIRESTDDKISGRGISGTSADDIRHYRAEARFLRAYQYWVMLDLFANPPFITENDPIGSFLPPQTKRADLFAYIESELKAIEPALVAARQNEYGRADAAAADALLARLYLNAEVYLGQGKGRYTDAITYALKVINAGYTLADDYAHLFKADNNLNNPEVILSINYDGISTQNYGGTTFLVNAAISAALNPVAFGVPNGGWGGIRSTENLPDVFGDYSGATDKRAIFLGSKKQIDDPTLFTDGLAVGKYKNILASGAAAPSSNGTFCSIDFPLFRLPEMYLVYAEAVKRGGTGGDEATAVQYINALRTRAYGDKSGNITSYAVNDVLDERARELYWEGFRRTDLVRYSRFTTADYLWPWKGGIQNGKGVDAHYNVFPLPAADLTANPHLVQNTGY